jgi:hypothetical protein
MSRLKLYFNQKERPGDATHRSSKNPMKGWRYALLALSMIFAVALFLAPQQSMAQESRGTISGTVTDPTGAAIPNAQVVVTEVNSGTTSKSKSNAAGQYVVPFLLPGKYSITVESEGFKKSVRAGIELDAAAHLIIDMKLQLGSAQQTVTVTAAAPLLNTASASIGQTITTKEVADLPLNGRTPMMLSELSIGVLPTGQPSQVHPFDNNGAAAWSIAGSPSQTSEILMDGVPDELWNGTLAYSPPQATVKQVSVQAFDTDASVGHTYAGVINQILKSGGNKFHGKLYEYGQISAIDANNWFNDLHNKPNPVTHYNQYGLEADGPVWIPHVFDGRNKIFWMFAWEGLKDSQPSTDLATVPTAAERTGDFSALLPVGCSKNGGLQAGNSAFCADGTANPNQLYNPYGATEANGTITRQPITDNVLSNAGLSIDPVAAKYLQYYPAPNTTGKPDGEDNFISSVPSIDNYNNFLGRLDFNLGSATHMFFDFRRNLRYQAKQNYFNNAATGGTLDRSNWGASFDVEHTLNASTALDVRANWTYFLQTEGEPGDGVDPTTLGFPSYIKSNAEALTVPFIAFSGSCGSQTSFQCLGNNRYSRFPSNSYQLFAELMKTVGNHNFKFGIDARQYRLGAAAYKYPTGSYTFDTNWVQATSSAAGQNFGGDFASFLLGLPTKGEYDKQAVNSFYNYYIAGFAQDNWRVNSHLTLNIGLRYDFNTPYYDKHGAVVNGFDTTSASPIAAQAEAAYAGNYATGDYASPLPAPGAFQVKGGLTYPSSKNGAYYSNDSNWISPRFGFSWSPAMFNDKTVVRGGFGVFVSQYTIANLDANGTWSSNPVLDNEGFTAVTQLVPTLDNYLTPKAPGTGYLSDPFPGGIENPTGSSAGLATFLGQPISFIDPHPKTPYSIRWNIGIQQQITPNTMFEADYVGNHIVHTPVSTTDLNYLPRQYLSTLPTRDDVLIKALGKNVPNPFQGLEPGTKYNGSSATIAQLLSPYPQFPQDGVTEDNATTGQAYFNALYARIEHRMSHGLWLVANYGWSKLITRDVYLNPSDPTPNKHLSPFDYTNHIVIGATYDLPFGPNTAHNFHNRLLNEIAGGWVVNGIYTYQTGPPLYFSTDMVLTGNQIHYNSREAALNSSVFSNDAFVTGKSKQFEYHLRTFPLTLSSIRSNGINNLDSSVLKRFPIVKGVGFQLRFETFNTLNHPMFAPPAVDPSKSSFGSITKTANTSRQIQIGGELTF